MRAAAVAGRFYPEDPDELRATIDWCFSHPLGPGKPTRTGDTRSIRAVMAPHAGYVCSGMTAAHAYRSIQEDGLPELYVVIGPDHYGTAMGRNVLCSDDFSTPLGVCRTDREVCSRLARYYVDDPGAHRFEHAVEVQIPFIQTIDPDPTIVAITMGDQSPASAARLASTIVEACSGRDTLVVASTDMSHYVPKDTAARLDGMVLDAVSRMDVEGMYRAVYENRISMCGYGPTAVAMHFSAGCGATGVRHTDSYDSLGMDAGSVVGYGTAVFREPGRTHSY